MLVLSADETLSNFSRVYLKLLSDLAFVLARTLNRAVGEPDVLWRKDRRTAGG